MKPAAGVPAIEDLAGHLAAAATAEPTRPATILPRGRFRRSGFRTTTYGELDRRVDVIAAGLTAAGIGPGVRTALLVPPTEDFFALAFALLRAQAVPVLIDPGIGRAFVRTCLAEVAPAAFIGVPRAHLARRVLRWCPSASLLVTVGPPVPAGGRSLAAVERVGRALLPFRPPPVDPDATAAIAFTSGSTGVPKGVEYRQPHFLAQLRMIRELYDIVDGEVSLATFPPFALLGPALGLTTVVLRMDASRPARVNPERLADAANTFGATLMFGSPALLDTVSRWGERTGARLPTLRRVISAGAPVRPAVQRRLLGLLSGDAEVHTPYGATEALPVTSIGSRELLTLPEGGICVGRPVPGVDVALVRISDEPLRSVTDDLLVPAGEVGEVVVRGPNVTTSYAERPAATAAAKLDWDGRVAHRMGDLAYADRAGRLWFCGRKIHRVTTAAGTMFPVPCEEVFNAHPDVLRSALVGVGPRAGQRPVICVELERSARASAALTRALLDLAVADPVTARIDTVLYHPAFPVDVRHNAKIDREALAAWAARRL